MLRDIGLGTSATLSLLSIKIFHNFYIIRMELQKKCACKPQPTPEPPKHCKELEGEMCRYDEDCGEGGYCRSDFG